MYTLQPQDRSTNQIGASCCGIRSRPTNVIRLARKFQSLSNYAHPVSGCQGTRKPTPQHYALAELNNETISQFSTKHMESHLSSTALLPCLFSRALVPAFSLSLSLPLAFCFAGNMQRDQIPFSVPPCTCSAAVRAVQS
jgi:hypothetical protein